MKHAILVLLVGCGGSSPPPASTPTTSNTAEPPAVVPAPAPAVELTVETVPPPNETSREAAIRQAREAGILGDGTEPRSKAAIRGVVRAQLHQIQACYEAELVAQPTLAGMTLVTFTIEPDGTVSASAGSGFHANVDTCTAAVVKSLVFREAATSTQVSYPFSFAPAPDTDGDGT